MKFRNKFHPQIAPAESKVEPIRSAQTVEEEIPASINGNGHSSMTDVLPFSETLSDGFCRFDNAWKFIYVNEAAELFFGVNAKGMTGKRIWDLFPNLVDTRFFRECQRVVAENRPVKLEEFFTASDLWFAIRICPSEQGVAVYFRDVTERKLLEKQIREATQTGRPQVGSEIRQSRGRIEQFSALVDGILYEWDIHGGTVERFGAILKILGFESREVVSTPEWWNDRIHPKDLEQMRPVFIAKLRHEPGFCFEYRVRNKKGEYRFVRDEAIVIRDGEGHITQLLGCIKDITEQKQAAELEERWKCLFENARWGLVVSNAETDRIEFGNAAFAEMHGYSRQELVGRAIQDFFIPEECAKVPGWLKILQQKGFVSFESVHVRKDGINFPVQVDVFAQRNSEGEIAYRVVHCQDITERKRAEDRFVEISTRLDKAQLDLAEAQAQLKEGNKPLETDTVERLGKLEDVNEGLEWFSASVSHDLRAPLRSMRGFAHALLEDCGERLDEAGRDFALRIVRSAERMDHFVQDLLAYSRVTRAEIDLEIVNLGKLVEDVLERYQSHIEATGARIEVAGDLPMVQAHYFTLCQAFSNLLENAIKFVQPGTSPHVVIRAEEMPDHVRLCVDDQGIGIAAEHHGRIFHMFERLHADEAFSGSGIGLGIVQRAVERMGGEVGVQSQLGRGSCFWIQLPKPRLDP